MPPLPQEGVDSLLHSGIVVSGGGQALFPFCPVAPQTAQHLSGNFIHRLFAGNFDLLPNPDQIGIAEAVVGRQGLVGSTVQGSNSG